MATRYSPKIVTDGLVFCLDAANARSYPGTGTSWIDLVGIKYGTMTNAAFVSTGGPKADSGIMSFDGSGDYITFDNHSDFEIAGSSGYTIEAWVYPTSSSESYGGIIGCTQHTSGGAASSTINWQLYRSSGNFRIYASADLSIESGAYANNAWYQVVAVWNTALDSCSLYVNTVETTNSPDESLGSVMSIGSVNPRIGRADFNYYAHAGEAEFTGYMGPIRLYKNKALTAAEVQQNYIATKGRFGL